MDARYLNCQGKQIFLLRQEPQAKPFGGRAVIFANSAPFDAIRTGWARVHFAKIFRQSGYETYFFDYFGTGDSFGASSEFTLQQAGQDLASVVDYVRQQNRVKSLAIFGMRLGGSLAMEYCSQNRVDQLFLWEAVFNGESHWQELRRLHQDLIYKNIDEPPFPTRDCMKEQLLGYDLAPRLVQDLAQMHCENLQLQVESFYALTSSKTLGDWQEFVDRQNHIPLIKLISLEEEYHWKNWQLLNHQLIPSECGQNLREILREVAA